MPGAYRLRIEQQRAWYVDLFREFIEALEDLGRTNQEENEIQKVQRAGAQGDAMRHGWRPD